MMNHRLALAAADMTSPVAGADILVNSVAAHCDPLGALYLPDHECLVVSDLHLEKGAAFARRGMMLPPYDTLATLHLLSAVISRYDPKTVISLGDNFHDRRGSELMPEAFRSVIAGWRAAATGSGSTAITIRMAFSICPASRRMNWCLPASSSAMNRACGLARARWRATCIRLPPSVGAANMFAAPVLPAMVRGW